MERVKIGVVGAASATAGATGMAFVQPPGWMLPWLDRVGQELTVMSLVLLMFAIIQIWERISRDREWQRTSHAQSGAAVAVAETMEKFANKLGGIGGTVVLLHDEIGRNTRSTDIFAERLKILTERIERLDRIVSSGGHRDGNS